MKSETEMKVLLSSSNPEEAMSALLRVTDKMILVGYKNGRIRLWSINKSPDSYAFNHEKTFRGHSDQVNRLALLPNGRFVSSSADNTLRIWDINSPECQKVLKGGSVALSVCDSIAILEDDLIVVAGDESSASSCGYFDLWNAKTGEILFKKIAFFHRAYGISLAVTNNNYLAVHGHCSGSLDIWKVERTGCKKISSHKSERIYSMTTLPTGEIVTGGFNLNVYNCLADGTISKIKKMENSNVIDDIIPLNSYEMITIDRFNQCSGRLKLWNYMTGTSEMLGSSRKKSGEVADSHILLTNHTILSIGELKFYVQQFSPALFTPGYITEVRKNSRILAQASRDETNPFSRLPMELNIKIAAFTGNPDSGEKIASDHFCKPRVPL